MAAKSFMSARYTIWQERMSAVAFRNVPLCAIPHLALTVVLDYLFERRSGQLKDLFQIL
jgi:hypothetical protein